MWPNHVSPRHIGAFAFPSHVWPARALPSLASTPIRRGQLGALLFCKILEPRHRGDRGSHRIQAPLHPGSVESGAGIWKATAFAAYEVLELGTKPQILP